MSLEEKWCQKFCKVFSFYHKHIIKNMEEGDFEKHYSMEEVKAAEARISQNSETTETSARSAAYAQVL